MGKVGYWVNKFDTFLYNLNCLILRVNSSYRIIVGKFFVPIQLKTWISFLNFIKFLILSYLVNIIEKGFSTKRQDNKAEISLSVSYIICVTILIHLRMFLQNRHSSFLNVNVRQLSAMPIYFFPHGLGWPIPVVQTPAEHAALWTVQSDICLCSINGSRWPRCLKIFIFLIVT